MKIYISDYPKEGSNIPRKEDIRIDRWDTIDICTTLSAIIYPLLLKYKEERKTVLGVPSSIALNKNEEDAEKEWVEIIDHMIWSFKQIMEGYKDESLYMEETGEGLKFDSSGKLISTGYEIFDEEGMITYYENIQEGLNLFAKHFRDLWW